MTNVAIETSAGRILVKLYDNRAPKTVENFLDLTKKGFYNGLHFHRVIKDFMLQGGCPNSKDPNNPQAGMGGPGWKIKCEFHPELKHDKPGILSMANAGPGTNGSQFFITHLPTPWLDNNHTVFGCVSDEESQKTINSIMQNDKIESIVVEGDLPDSGADSQ